MIPVTAEQIKAACLKAGIERVPHHPCGGCGSWVAYLVRDDRLYFDSACGCSGFGSDPEPRSWEDAASWVNMQTDPVHRLSVAAKFGLALPQEASA